MPPRLTIPTINPLRRPTNPPILPIPPRATGNNVPKSLHKTRRSWWPNVTRVDLPVDILSTPVKPSSAASSSKINQSSSIMNLNPSAQSTKRQRLKGVKMNIARLRDVEKAGGVEGLLLSRPSKALTPFGRILRAQLFDKLHQRIENREIQSQASALVDSIPTTSRQATT